MQNYKDKINQISPIFFICGYLLLIITLVIFKIKPYNYNLSSLLGIWKGFAELNPGLIEKGFIIYNDGGYDGQFFYLISKSLFTEGFQSFPILDSFFLRFNRIGLSVLSGFLANFFGFKFYPIITLIILISLHIYSFKLLQRMLEPGMKYLSYFYLFSPFSINSILLLVSDSLFASLSVICIYIFKKHMYTLDNSSLSFKISIRKYILFFLIVTFSCLVKESGIIIIGSLLLLTFYDKNFKTSSILFLAIGIYLAITLLFKLLPNVNHGTNPLGFTDLVDYPLFGFFKSIQIHSMADTKSIFREMAKFPIFIFYLLLILNLRNIRDFRGLTLHIPIFFILFTAGVGEVGYWRSFDNISRMFTISIPWIIFLKQEDKAHNDYYALYLSSIILMLLIIRLVYVKIPMGFYIF